MDKEKTNMDCEKLVKQGRALKVVVTGRVGEGKSYLLKQLSKLYTKSSHECIIVDNVRQHKMYIILNDSAVINSMLGR